jgi:hypothetical protein
MLFQLGLGITFQKSFPICTISVEFGNHFFKVIPNLCYLSRVWESLLQNHSQSMLFQLGLGITFLKSFPICTIPVEFGNHFYKVIPNLHHLSRVWESLFQSHSQSAPSQPGLGITFPKSFPICTISAEFGNHFSKVIPNLCYPSRVWESLFQSHAKRP